MKDLSGYGHPILVVETFVDPDQFQGTVYTANGWIELGKTDGWGRQRRDYYVKHDTPKRLFVRALARQACRSLQAEHLKPSLAVVEANVPVRCTQRVKEIQQQLRGPAPKDELVVLEGKEPKHGSGASILTAVSVPSPYYLGGAVGDVKTNEIPVAQKTVIPPLERQGHVDLGPVPSHCQQPLHGMVPASAPTRARHHHRLPNPHGRRTSRQSPAFGLGPTPIAEKRLMNWRCWPAPRGNRGLSTHPPIARVRA